ncbi:MAG: hypothetical protein U9N30_01640 [Campylobacterota bacterium]|nr:hypothetical protein [Campylobacterota bacterium]
MFLHYAFFNTSIVPTVKNLTALTQISGLSLSTGYFEPRFAQYADYRDVFYPSMAPVHTLDFVYAK